MGIVSDRIRKQVYKKCNGRCAYCGKKLEYKAMQADHLIPCYWTTSDQELADKGLTRGADHVDNMMPSCRRCNKWKSNYVLEIFRNEIFAQHERLLKEIPGYKLGIDYGFILFEPWDGKFYFEKMEGFSHSLIPIR